MSNWYLDFEETFHSFRKQAREKLRISFSRAYILVMILLIIVGIFYVWTLNVSANSGYQMTSVETVRREKQQIKHFLQSQVAIQESLPNLNAIDDRMVPIAPDERDYILSGK